MAEVNGLLEGYIAVKELAAQLGKHHRTIERWNLPYVQLGATKMIKVDAARAALESRVRRNSKGA